VPQSKLWPALSGYDALPTSNNMAYSPTPLFLPPLFLSQQLPFHALLLAKAILQPTKQQGPTPPGEPDLQRLARRASIEILITNTPPHSIITAMIAVYVQPSTSALTAILATITAPATKLSPPDQQLPCTHERISRPSYSTHGNLPLQWPSLRHDPNRPL